MSHNTVLITGSSSGIGATYADRLAKRGHDLILVARNRERLDALAARLKSQFGVGVEVVVGDLTKKSDVERIEARLRDDAAIVMLVNNAGVAIAGPLASNDADRLEEMVQLNTIAPMRLARAAVQNFHKKGGGTIINIASVLALAPELFNGTYSGTKAFLLNFSQALATELKGRNIRIQCVLPGATRTEIWEKSGAGENALPDEMVMETGEMVDAALAGFDNGEFITIPSLPEPTDWDKFEATRLALMPNLSHKHAAKRYRA